jgi:SynChlorMet cassette protein ScmC
MTASGSVCSIASGNPAAIPVVQFMAEAMGLPADAMKSGDKTPLLSQLQLFVQPEERQEFLPGTGTIQESGEALICRLAPAADRDVLATQMIWLSPFFTNAVERSGGALIHGALVEWKESGIIFAGPGGIGKSTLCRRLPESWKSLSDDMTLVDRDADGNYWAHPWPTWSRFMWGGSGSTWHVSSSVPLKAIFILEQGTETKIVSCGAGQSAMLLDEVADQASFFAYDSLNREHARRHRVNRFNSVCALAQSIPTAILHTSLTLPFSDELEHFLEPNPRLSALIRG